MKFIDLKVLVSSPTRRTKILLTVGMIFLLLIAAGCQGAPESTANTSDAEIEQASTPTPLPTNTPVPPTNTPLPPTNTPAPTNTPEPSFVFELYSAVPDWASGKIGLNVVKGDFVYPSGATARAGSQIYIMESDLVLKPGMMLVIGAGGITLNGTSYPEGAKLYVNSASMIEVVEGSGGTQDSDAGTIGGDAAYLDWTIMLEDSFSTDNGWWDVGDQTLTGSKASQTITGEKFSWKIEGFESRPMFYQVLQSPEFSDFYVATEVEKLSGSEPTGGGVIFRVDSDEYFYAFAIDPENGKYTINRWFDGDWTILLNWTETDLINKGKANKIAVLGEGSHFTFYVNDRELDQLEDNSIGMGRVGLIAMSTEPNSNNQIGFDNFEFRLPDEEILAGNTGVPEPISNLPNWSVLMTDTFNSNVNQWFEGDENYTKQEGNFEVSNGVYRWYIKSNDEFAGYYQIATLDAVDDFYASVEIERITGIENAAYGLAFRIDEDWQQYRFIMSADYNVFLVLGITDDWYTLIDWTYTDAIHTTGTNEMAVLAQGSHFQFFINGELVAELDDSKIPSGILGFSAEVYEKDDTLTVEYDNFTVYAP